MMNKAVVKFAGIGSAIFCCLTVPARKLQFPAEGVISTFYYATIMHQNYGNFSVAVHNRYGYEVKDTINVNGKEYLIYCSPVEHEILLRTDHDSTTGLDIIPLNTINRVSPFLGEFYSSLNISELKAKTFNVNSTGPKEVVFYWKANIAGSGYYSTYEGISIADMQQWKLLFFDLRSYHTEELRIEKGEAYGCERDIRLQKKHLKIKSGNTCAGRNTDNLFLMQDGEYEFRRNALVRVSFKNK